MSSKARTSLFSLTVIAVLIFSAIGPTIAYADGDNPQEATASQTVVESDSGENEGGECSADQEAAKKKRKKKKNRNQESAECRTLEQPADTSGSESVEVSGEEVAAEEGASAEDVDLLAGLPENTSVTVLNAEGQAEPLATQEAADAIATTTDPIWCPEGAPPIPGANGCTPSFDNFTDLLNHLSTNVASFSGAGIIYVEQGNYAGSESVIDFNTFNLSNISGSNLTVQGGWDTTPNPVDPATAGTSNFLGVEFIIGSSTNPWGGSLTFNNIVLQDPNQTGLTLYSQSDINLSNVTVDNSALGDGAVLNAGGNVTINNSHFTRNTAGARVTAGGNVAIANSEFSNPFNQRRQVTGLEVTSNGSVSLFNVLAIGNRRRGADIEAGGRVTIGSSEFSETNGLNGGVFYGFGLRVVTPDAIDLAFVTANNNFLWGADLDAGGDVNISDSMFNANSTESPTFIDDTGLLVTSGGNVTLNRVEANGNRLIGAVIDAAGFVNIDSSTFSDNRGVTTTATGSAFHGLGLQVVSLSNVILSGVTASGNGLTGANVLGGNVTITNSIFSSNTTGSATDLLGNGVLVASSGNAVLFNVTMDSNQLNGGTIQATANTILDSVTATNNGENGVVTEAACTGVINGSYSGNGQYGLFLINPALSLSGSPVFANNGAGDIFPPNPGICTLAFTPAGSSGVSTTSNVQVSLSNSNTSGLQQAISYPAASRGGSTGISLSAISLDGLMYGITREAIPGGVVTRIFTGNYIYVYTYYDSDSSIDGLEIIAVNPAPPTGVAMVGP